MKNIIREIEKQAMLSEIQKSFSEEAYISIKKEKSGMTDIHIEGNGGAILLTLAGAERGILKKMDLSKEDFELIKEIVGVMEDIDE